MRIRHLLVAAAVTGAAFFGGAASAGAAGPRDGVCDPVHTYGYGFGEACFFYGAYQQGSLADFSAEGPNPDLYVSDSTLADDLFLSSGVGQGLPVNNRARSVCNTDWYPLYVYTGYNFTGTRDPARWAVMPELCAMVLVDLVIPLVVPVGRPTEQFASSFWFPACARR